MFNKQRPANSRFQISRFSDLIIPKAIGNVLRFMFSDGRQFCSAN